MKQKCVDVHKSGNGYKKNSCVTYVIKDISTVAPDGTHSEAEVREINLSTRCDLELGLEPGTMVRWDKNEAWDHHKKRRMVIQQNLIPTGPEYGGGAVMLCGCFSSKDSHEDASHRGLHKVLGDFKLRSGCLCQDVTTGSWLNLPAGQWSTMSIQVHAMTTQWPDDLRGQMIHKTRSRTLKDQQSHRAFLFYFLPASLPRMPIITALILRHPVFILLMSNSNGVKSLNAV